VCPFTFKIEILKTEETSLDVIVDFTIEAEKLLDPQMRCGKTREEVEKYVKGAFAAKEFHYIFAKKQDKIVGIAGCHTFSKSMVWLEYWHPLVLPGEHYEEVFQLLVTESIKHTKSIGKNRLEVFLMNITDENRPIYHRVGPLYEAGGMRRGNEWSQMVCDLTASKLIEPDLPKGFSLKLIKDVSNEEIWPSYNATFLASGDRRYINQTEAQRKESFDDFFNRKQKIEEDASLLLYFNEQVVGFMKINLYDGEGFVNGIGTHPDFRRRGLAKLLMTASLVRAARNGMKKLVLEVDINNKQAIGLYEKLGFEKKRGSISHVWTG
jgi:ribosomal protein S18 acetylase RimI-like enzyme